MACTPVWADSLGAKSTCWFVESPDCSVCIDPGVAVMQPSYPLPDVLKRYYERRARSAIGEAMAAADLTTISHYHYDHFLTDPAAYDNTDLWVKDPNRWINDSQWDRARVFLSALAAVRGERLTERPPAHTSFADPYESLVAARGKEFGDYQPRREELLAEGRERFENRTARWRAEPWVDPPTDVHYADGRIHRIGETTIRFVGPLFHGIEYARTGWVLATVVETPEATFAHTSDLEGPTVEDYADRLVEIDPDVLFMDGPSTYLLGYLLNRINLERAIENAIRVVREAEPEVTVWDHHLLRDRRYRTRTERFWKLREEGYRVETVAELAGEEPMVDRAVQWSDAERAERVNRAENALGEE